MLTIEQVKRAFLTWRSRTLYGDGMDSEAAREYAENDVREWWAFEYYLREQCNCFVVEEASNVAGDESETHIALRSWPY